MYIFLTHPGRPDPLGIPVVSFPNPRRQLNVTWPLSRMDELVDAYFVNISGPNDLCGNGNTLQRVTGRSYTCTIQTMPQEGETYTFSVAAASCNGSLRGRESSSAPLQGIPVYWNLTFGNNFNIYWMDVHN